MIKRTAMLAQSLFVAAFIAGPSFAADDEALKKDMTRDRVAGIAVRPGRRRQGECGERLRLSCKDGNRYRVYVNAAGRVVVEKQK